MPNDFIAEQPKIRLIIIDVNRCSMTYAIIGYQLTNNAIPSVFAIIPNIYIVIIVCLINVHAKVI